MTEVKANSLANALGAIGVALRDVYDEKEKLEWDDTKPETYERVKVVRRIAKDLFERIEETFAIMTLGPKIQQTDKLSRLDECHVRAVTFFTFTHPRDIHVDNFRTMRVVFGLRDDHMYVGASWYNAGEGYEYGCLGKAAIDGNDNLAGDAEGLFARCLSDLAGRR